MQTKINKPQNNTIKQIKQIIKTKQIQKQKQSKQNRNKLTNEHITQTINIKQKTKNIKHNNTN